MTQCLGPLLVQTLSLKKSLGKTSQALLEQYGFSVTANVLLLLKNNYLHHIFLIFIYSLGRALRSCWEMPVVFNPFCE